MTLTIDAKYIFATIVNVNSISLFFLIIKNNLYYLCIYMKVTNFA